MDESEENSEPSKYLINPEDLFRSKELKNKSLAEIAILGLEPHLEDLPDKKRIMVAGNAVTKGGNYKGSIRTAGNFVTSGLTVTNKLQTAGNSVIKELIIVKDTSTLAGNAVFRSNAIFAGKTVLAGTVTVQENIISSNSLTIGGTATVKKRIISDGRLLLTGHVTVDQIHSLSSVQLKGKVFVNGDLKAKKLQLDGGAQGRIGGEVFSKTVGVGNNRKLKRYIQNYEEEKNFENPLELIKYVGRLIFNPFLRTKSKDPFEIEGDIIADEVFLENIIIKGDVNARRITIGDNVSIKGVVEYSEELILLGEDNYNTTKISPAEQLYIDPDEKLRLSEED